MRRDLALWCVREVDVQQDRVNVVPDLYYAYTTAESFPRQLWDPGIVQRIGARVKPSTNKNGWRNHNVYIGEDSGAPWQEVPRLMDALGEALEGGMSPHDWFVAFERIHPFGDGNGRTGAVIANVLMENRDEDLLLSYEIHDFYGNCPNCEREKE